MYQGVLIVEILPKVPDLSTNVSIDQVLMRSNILRWYGHVCRIPDTSLPKKVYGQFKGRGTVGRPRKFWNNVLLSDTQRLNIRRLKMMLKTNLSGRQGLSSQALTYHNAGKHFTTVYAPFNATNLQQSGHYSAFLLNRYNDNLLLHVTISQVGYNSTDNQSTLTMTPHLGCPETNTCPPSWYVHMHVYHF